MHPSRRFHIMGYAVMLGLLSLLTRTDLFGQPIRRTLRVKAGNDIAQAYSPQGFYRFPQFEEGNIYFKDGSEARGRFNFNFLSGSFQFIKPISDTLDLANQENIDSAVFGKAAFLHRDGWLERMADADSVVLLRKVIIRTQTENIGAYGVPNNTGTIEHVTNYITTSGVYSLVSNQDVVVAESIGLYFMDRNNNLVKSSRANLLKLLSPAGRARAENFLAKNKTSFDQPGDLKTLMEAIAR